MDFGWTASVSEKIQFATDPPPFSHLFLFNRFHVRCVALYVVQRALRHSLGVEHRVGTTHDASSAKYA